MKKTHNIYTLIVLLSLLLAGCTKEGDIVVKPILAIKPYLINGYVIGQPLEQYFDGVKEKELYGRVGNGFNTIAFEKNETYMELKKKGSGDILYHQMFNINEDTCKGPVFYYDGTMHDTYTYPVAQGKDYLTNFYLDAPKDSGMADVYMEVEEFYYDWDDMDDPLRPLPSTFMLVAKDVPIGKWTEYTIVNEMPVLPPKHPESMFWPRLVLKKAGTNAYYIRNKRDLSSINFQMPDMYRTKGKTQSIHLTIDKGSPRINAVDLVQVFQP